MTRGFRNTTDADGISGYQVNIRMPYYRGTFLSLVHQLELVVDGTAVPREQLSVEVGGRDFSLAAMEEADDVRWEFGAPAKLKVRQRGGLVPGGHTVQVGIIIRKSYLPHADPERLYAEFEMLYRSGSYRTFLEGPTVVRRTMTLVQ